MKCRLCNNEQDNQELTLCGTMYGTKGEFKYFICGRCGSLQTVNIHHDLSKFYDTDTYYAFNMDQRGLKNHLLMSQMKHQVKKKNLLGMLVQLIYPVEYGFYNLISPKKDAILDVGCGQGETLFWLRQLGYKKLTGLDPYIEKNTCKENISFFKTDLIQYHTEKKYKMITFIHSFEHLPNAEEVLEKAVELLDDSGYLIIQLPFLSHFYFQKYGRKLYTLDPPRHIFIPTYAGMRELLQQHGLQIVDFTTKFDPAIPTMARNIKNGTTEKNQGTGFISGTFTSLTSFNLRHKLQKQKDGAIATFVIKKE